MNQIFVSAVLILATLVGLWRTRGRQRFVRSGLLLLTAGALWLLLFPPTTERPFAAGALVVLTPGATPAQRAALPIAAEMVALPGVAASRGAQRVPDLATALRRFPATRSLHVVGGGLPPRDRDAAGGRVASFDAAPLPRGLVELESPPSVLAGHAWRLDGRVEGVAGGRVELLDPAGDQVGVQALAADGRFGIDAQARQAGNVLFTLNVLDADGARIDAVPVPLAVDAGAPLRVLLLAGAPDPDLKYLRRWAVDAGIALDSRIVLSEGVALREGNAALDRAALQRADLVVLDERAWAALIDGERRALMQAVPEGLGLLLRVTGPVPDAVARDWADLGFRLRVGEHSAPVRLGGVGDTAAAIELSRAAVEVDAGAAAPLLRATDGSALAWVRNRGRGRVALWVLADNYRLQLGGAGSALGSLWSDAFRATARARGAQAPRLPQAARVDERAVFCGLTAAAVVEVTSGQRTTLKPDTDGCAAWWPSAPGWHALVTGDSRAGLHVRARDEAATLARAANRAATEALVGAVGGSSTTADTREQPWPRWPFFLAFLTAAAALWWLERTSEL